MYSIMLLCVHNVNNDLHSCKVDHVNEINSILFYECVQWRRKTHTTVVEKEDKVKKYIIGESYTNI